RDRLSPHLKALVLGRLLRARRLYARWLAGHLRKVRRVRRLADSFTFVALDPAEQHTQVADRFVDPRLNITESGKPSRHRREREVLGLDVGELVPGDRSGDRRITPRAGRIRRRD